jgi:hypothetical protein
MEKKYCLTQTELESLFEKQKFLCGEEFIKSPNIDKSYWRILSAPYPAIPENKEEGMLKRLYNRFIYRKVNLV